MRVKDHWQDGYNYPWSRAFLMLSTRSVEQKKKTNEHTKLKLKHGHWEVVRIFVRLLVTKSSYWQFKSKTGVQRTNKTTRNNCKIFRQKGKSELWMKSQKRNVYIKFPECIIIAIWFCTIPHPDGSLNPWNSLGSGLTMFSLRVIQNAVSFAVHVIHY